MKKIYYLLAMFAFSFQGFAQPANDDCNAPIEITVNAAGSCENLTAGTLAGATDSGEGDNGAGTPNDDVWFTFIATNETQYINLFNVDGFPLDLVHEVMEGTCGGGLTSLMLMDDPNHSVVTGLTVGSTYYLRVFSYSDLPAESTTFDVCVSDPPLPPSNDNCADAIAVDVNPDYSCTIVASGTLAGATDSGEGNNGVGTPSDDVWYTFVATSESQRVRVLNIDGDVTDLVHEVFEGSCNGGLTSLSINDGNSTFLNDLTVGNTYYVRVFSYQDEPSSSTTFDICIGTPPPPPANDNCDAAISVDVNPDYNCGTVTSGILDGATDSDEGDNGAGTPSDDVWYTFVATAETQKVSLNNISGDVTDLVHEVLEGTCGGGLTSLNVSDNNSSRLSGLTVGNTYYVRVFSYQTDPSTSTSFDLCIGTPPPPPANDDCAAAVELTVGDFDNCSSTSGTLAGATDSGEGDNGEGTPSDDVWYTFIATAETQIISLSNIEGDATFLMQELLEGTCGGGFSSLNLTYLETSAVTNLVPGNTYYLRVFSYQDDPAESTTFDVCVTGGAEAPANDDCSGAVGLTVNPDYNCAATTHGALAGATDSGEGNNGVGTPSDDVWYTFVATQSSQRVSLLNIEGDTSDLVIELLEGTCGGGLTSIDISDPQTVNFSGLTEGNTYFLRIFSYQENPSISTTFDICVGTPPPPPSNDDCSGAIAITPTPTIEGGVISSTNGATDSEATSTFPEAECNGYEGGDIWFTTTIPPSGNLTLEVSEANNNDGFDSVIAAYSGTCDNLTVINCDDDSADTSFFSKLQLSAMTPGEVIYIRVYGYGNDEEEPFTISAYDESVLATTGFNAAGFSAVPNPVTDILNLSYTKNITNVEVYNLVGQQIIAKTVNNRQDKLDMSYLTAGTYLVKVTADGQTKTIKVLKK